MTHDIIYLNFHGDRPSMPFTSEAEARARAASPAFDENPPSDVAIPYVPREMYERLQEKLQAAIMLAISRYSQETMDKIVQEAVAAAIAGESK